MAKFFKSGLTQYIASVLCLVVIISNSVADAFNRKTLAKIGNIINPVTHQQEIYIGAQMDGVVRNHYEPISNIALQEYVNEIGKKIARVSYKNYPYTYTVIADARETNAFAAPGGFIYITTGMINMLENEAQLAAILAHETAHVIKRHSVKQMQEQNATDMALVLLNKVTDIELNNRWTRLGEFLMFQKFSRQDEFEADIIGVDLMARAGYNPKGMVELLDKLNRLESRGVFISFINSHPSSESRLHMIEMYIERNKLEKPNHVLDTSRFHRFTDQ